MGFLYSLQIKQVIGEEKKRLLAHSTEAPKIMNSMHEDFLWFSEGRKILYTTQKIL
jgi:hypothetical protein